MTRSIKKLLTDLHVETLQATLRAVQGSDENSVSAAHLVVAWRILRESGAIRMTAADDYEGSEFITGNGDEMSIHPDELKLI